MLQRLRLACGTYPPHSDRTLHLDLRGLNVARRTSDRTRTHKCSLALLYPLSLVVIYLFKSLINLYPKYIKPISQGTIKTQAAPVSAINSL